MRRPRRYEEDHWEEVKELGGGLRGKDSSMTKSTRNKRRWKIRHEEEEV